MRMIFQARAISEMLFLKSQLPMVNCRWLTILKCSIKARKTIGIGVFQVRQSLWCCPIFTDGLGRRHLRGPRSLEPGASVSGQPHLCFRDCRQRMDRGKGNRCEYGRLGRGNRSGDGRRHHPPEVVKRTSSIHSFQCRQVLDGDRYRRDYGTDISAGVRNKPIYPARRRPAPSKLLIVLFCITRKKLVCFF